MRAGSRSRAPSALTAASTARANSAGPPKRSSVSGRTNLNRMSAVPGGRPTKVHGQDAVLGQEEHAERRRRLVGHDGRRRHAAPLHREGEEVVGAELGGRRRLVQARAEDRPQRVGHAARGGDQLAHPLGTVLLERAHHGRVQHGPRLQAALEALRPDAADQRLVAGHQSQPRSDRAVLVQAGGAEVHAQLQHSRVVERGGAHAGAARVVDVDRGAAVVGELDDRADGLQRHQLVGDGQAGEDDERHRRLALHGPGERVDADRVDEARSGLGGRADHRRVAVAGRGADHDVARPDQRQVGGERGAGQPVEDGHVVESLGASQVLEGQRLQAIGVDRRRQLVVRPGDLLAGHGQPVLQAREHEDRFGTVRPDVAPGATQLAVVVLGGGQDAPARVGERRGVGIAEAVRGHRRLLGVSRDDTPSARRARPPRQTWRRLARRLTITPSRWVTTERQ